MGSLKDRLLSRERPVTHYPVRVASVEETTDAEKAVLLARKAVLAVKADDKAGARKAQKALEEAQSVRDACYEKIPLRALPPDEFEALRSAYPELESDDEKVARAADKEYLHAVFVASAESDMSEADWDTFVHENLSTGERIALYDSALAINGWVRSLDSATPKG